MLTFDLLLRNNSSENSLLLDMFQDNVTLLN